MAGATGKRLTGIILFIVAALGVAAFLFLLFADAEGISNVPGTENIPAAAIIAAIALGIVALILVILLLVRTYDRREADAAEAEAFFIPEDIEDDLLEFAEVTDEGDNIESTGDDVHDARLSLEKVVPHDLATVPLGSQAWGTVSVNGTQRVHSFHYPIGNAMGLYNNDYITISANGDQIKLRTLLAAPPHAFDGMQDEPIKPAHLSSAATKDVAARLAARKGGAKAKAPVEEEPVAKPAPKKAPAKKAAPAYYDYSGDVHDVIDVEGIGPVYAKRLQAIGVKTTARLCYENPASLARSIQAKEKSVKSWQNMAELMRVNGIGPQYAEALARAGVDGIADIKKRSPSAIADQVNAYLDTLEVNVLGQKITERRVEGWKKAVKPMRKTRRAVPEE